MATIWVIGEMNRDGSLTSMSTEIATLGRSLARAAGTDVAGIVVAADPTAAATELAALPAARRRDC